ncbi:MAG TPA: molybdenum cofactor biosynthesis protein B [Candidatus Tenderia sp.]|nr:molybdenum cofactor biosynthesis protein B [Candidatus Tenderia sp.]
MTTPAGREFIPLSIAVLTISDTRNEETDKSGGYLATTLQEAGHSLADKVIVKDDLYRIRAQVAQWIADEEIQVVITTGGTGFSQRDVTPEAVTPLLDKEIPGFGELFRMLSFDQIGASTIQSRALGGLANKTFVFALPGSANACKTGWELILRDQLNYTHKPCNFVELMPSITQQWAERLGK